MARVGTLTAESNELSPAGYVRAIAFLTLVMAGTVGLGSYISYGWPSSILTILLCFGAAVVGIFVFGFSQSFFVGFLGISGMSLALGLMMGPLVALFKADVVIMALVITLACMVIMSLLGILFPGFVSGWGPFLMAGLTLLVVAQFAQIAFMAMGIKSAGHMPVITWFGVALFLGFTAWDWSMALNEEPTWRNALEASGSLILDAVNLFIRFLEIMGPGVGDAASSVGETVSDAASGIADSFNID